MCDEVTKSENVSASRKRGDAVTASPRPWRIPEVGLVPTEIWSADGTPVARGVSGLNAALICDAVNLKARIDEAMADESGYLHPVALDGKPVVFVEPPPSEAEESRMHREYERSLLVDRERFRRGYYEAAARNDRLRDLVRRLANMAETTIPDAMENWDGFTSGRVEFEREAHALIREAREAIGEDKP